VVARLETENSAAKTALLDNLPALRERLAEQGLRIDRFDVDLMQRQPGGMPDRPFNQQQDNSAAVRSLRPTPVRADAALPSRPSLAPVTAPGGLNVIV
jgi:flagellar hook-length control protein FliK